MLHVMQPRWKALVSKVVVTVACAVHWFFLTLFNLRYALALRPTLACLLQGITFAPCKYALPIPDHCFCIWWLLWRMHAVEGMIFEQIYRGWPLVVVFLSGTPALQCMVSWIFHAWTVYLLRCASGLKIAGWIVPPCM